MKNQKLKNKPKMRNKAKNNKLLMMKMKHYK